MTHEQPSLFDAIEARKVTEQAIEQVDANADPIWKSNALMALDWLSRARHKITADDVWEYLNAHRLDGPHEPAALGAIFRTAAAKGWIKQTQEFEPSKRPAAHCRPLRVWRSTR